MDLATLVAKYDRPAPRYTSYPTALELVEGFDPAPVWRELEGARESGRPLSLYVHVPFCRVACAYCGCSRVIAPRIERADPYLERVEHELRMWRAKVGGERPVVQLHLGGGTPTFLDDERLGALIASLERHLRFAPDAERSIEIDPRTVDRDRVRALARMGFDRISVGVQDFDEHVQEIVRRKQSPELVRAVVESAREAGIRSVNFDLIYGLPAQTVATLDRTLDQVLELSPDRVAAFGYAHLPARFPLQRTFDPASMPTPLERLALFERVRERMLGAGYLHLGLDHFAKPTDPLAIAARSGDLHRNFQGYTTARGVDAIGLGATSIGHVGRHYLQNERELDGYYAAIDADRLPIARGLTLSDDDLARAEVIDALLCQGRVDVGSVERRFGRELWAGAAGALSAMAEDGLLELEDRRLSITEEGRPFARVVALAFDAYRKNPAPVHARAL